MNIYDCDDTDIHKVKVDIQIMNLYEYDDTDIHKVKYDIQCFSLYILENTNFVLVALCQVKGHCSDY